MTLRKGFPAKLAATDADDVRYDLGGLVASNADGSPHGGVFGPARNLITGKASMAVDVAPFFAAAVRDGGVVLLSNDGVTTVSIATAPVSNSRIDVIYAKQNDASATVITPDANNTPIIAVAQGTAAPTPTRPAIPTGAVELGYITVPAGATTTNSGVVITQSAPYTAAQGGEVHANTFSDLSGWTTAPERQKGVVDNDPTPTKNGSYQSRGDGTWERFGSPVHIEYIIAVNGHPEAQYYTTPGFTADPTLTTAPEWASVVSNKLRLFAGANGPAIFVVDYVLLSPAVFTGRSFVELIASTDVLGSRGFATSGENKISTSLQVPVLTPGGSVDVTVGSFFTTGGSRNVAGRIRVTRIALA